jgi:polyhydroxyalkanoate synthesis regulator phasin
MPQAKKPTSSTKSSGSPSRSAGARSGAAARGSGGGSRKSASGRRPAAASRRATPAAQTEPRMEQLQRFLDPREVIVVTRERLQEALDEAVERGRMTRDDAGDLLADLVRRGRTQTEDLREGIEGLLEGTRKTVALPAERALREVDRARRVAGLGPSFPITGYDDLTAAQVTERLGDLSAPELRKVRDYEKRNANRKGVLAAVEQKLK